MDINKIAKILYGNRWAITTESGKIHCIKLNLIDALADYFEAEISHLHTNRRPHDCSANCQFDRVEFLRIAKGE